MAGGAMSGGLTRRERLKREREERILDAAAAVFAEKGYHGATVHDIAVHADVADGTIYNYFDNKFDLIIGILARVTDLDGLPDELMSGLHGDPRAFFVAAFRDRLARIAYGQEMLTAILPQVFVNDHLRGRFYRQYVSRISPLLEGYIQAQVDRGYIHAVDAPLLTRVVQAAFIGMLVMRILGDEVLHTRWDEVPELLAGILFEGIGDSREE
ncbi:MAG: TetR/AcrR family transcriptional regulator [Anaerolineae bacterium]|nr:TetR/AcrR family transcriptional regulator [Anaerolineae bacterium]